MKNLTWQNPEQLFVAQVLINKVKSKCCGIKDIYENQKSPKHPQHHSLYAAFITNVYGLWQQCHKRPEVQSTASCDLNGHSLTQIGH